MKKFYEKKLPCEMYLMLLTMLVAAIPVAIFSSKYPQLDWNALDYAKNLSEGRFKLVYFGLGLFGLYALYKKKHLNPKEKFLGLLWAFVYLLAFAGANLAIGRVVAVLSYSVELDSVVAASRKLGYFENLGLGYLPFFFHKHLGNTWFEKFILICYLKFYYLLAIAIFATFGRNLSIARKYLFSVIIVALFGFIGWYFIPIIGPIMIYKLPQTYPGTLSPELHLAFQQASFSEDASGVIDYLAFFWGVAKPDFNAVSNFPSMHVAWSFLAFFAISKVSFGPLKGLAFAWAICCTIGAIYTFQHMHLDLVAGLIVAVLSWKIADYFVSRDEKQNNEVFFKIFS